MPGASTPEPQVGPQKAAFESGQDWKDLRKGACEAMGKLQRGAYRRSSTLVFSLTSSEISIISSAGMNGSLVFTVLTIVTWHPTLLSLSLEV